MTLRALTAAADPSRPIPESNAERSWAIDTALESLRGEERRLAMLGFEEPLARCHQQRRFWEFVRAVNEISESRRAA